MLRFWAMVVLWYVKWFPHIILWFTFVPITEADRAGMCRDRDRLVDLWIAWNAEENI